MNGRRVVGLVLVAVGMIVLLWGGVFWTDRDTVLDAGPLTRYLRVGSLQHYVNVRIGQQRLQALYPLFKPFQLIDLLWCFHSYYLSSGAIAILANPSFDRSVPSHPILTPH